MVLPSVYWGSWIVIHATLFRFIVVENAENHVFFEERICLPSGSCCGNVSTSGAAVPDTSYLMNLISRQQNHFESFPGLPLMDELSHLLLQLLPLQLLLQENLEARHMGGPLRVLLVGLGEKRSTFMCRTTHRWITARSEGGGDSEIMWMHDSSRQGGQASAFTRQSPMGGRVLSSVHECQTCLDHAWQSWVVFSDSERGTEVSACCTAALGSRSTNGQKVIKQQQQMRKHQISIKNCICKVFSH